MCAGDGQGAAVTQTRTHNNVNEITSIAYSQAERSSQTVSSVALAAPSFA
jgi:hypothetical protein